MAIHVPRSPTVAGGLGQPGRIGSPRLAASAAFSPFDIGWHTAAWAEDPAWTAPADGAAVSSWRDGSGNGRTLTQATGSKQPTYRAAAASMNGRPALDFDGVDDRLTTALFASVLPQPFSMVVVGLLSGGGVAAYLVGGLASANNATVYKNGADFTGNAGSPGPTASHDTTRHLLRFYANGAASVIGKDGATSAPANAGTNSLGGLSIAARGDDVAATFGAVVCSFVGIYAGDVAADPGWSSFKAWVASLYGITVA